MTTSRLLVPLDGATLPTADEVGGKAASIARMRHLGLPVPPAFALSVTACRQFHHSTEQVSGEVWQAARDGIAILERDTGRTFGHGPRPLLLSVRSGAPVSMPGMMDTVLNLGMNDEAQHQLEVETGDPQFAEDTHRRFLESFGKVVCRAEIDPGTRLEPAVLRDHVLQDSGNAVPTDPWEQLRAAIAAVFRSWNSRRARAYRRHWKISDDGGTAVTVQAMIFGNVDEMSGTGVLFTRDPLTGADEPYGEYLPRAQGEDVVSGAWTPQPLANLRHAQPEVHGQLVKAGRMLERECRDAQDVEFTIERGRLYLLQSRSAKRSPQAAVKIAVSLVQDGALAPEDAVRRVTAAQIRNLLHPVIDPAARESAKLLLKGEPASPGIARGVTVRGSSETERRAAAGEDVVLTAATTSPEDVGAMTVAVGVLTEIGGSTSHAAVVTRALGLPCVVGCGAGTLRDLDGQEVTIDGQTGEVFAGLLPVRTVSPAEHPECATLTEWARQLAPIDVIDHDEAAAFDTVVDLDEQGVVDVAEAETALANAKVARGRVLETDEGVQAAIKAGVGTIIVNQPLPALLAAIATLSRR